jgi:hypothetical protein
MNTISSNDIYIKLSENMINTLNRFKKNEIKENILNENLLLNTSSMCKFLDGKEYVEDNLDVVIASKLQQGIDSKIKLQEIETRNRKDSILITNEETSFLKDIKNADENNITYDMNESLFSSSIMMTGNQNTNNIFDESISYSRVELSTIYNKDINNTTLLENSFQNFYNKINIQDNKQTNKELYYHNLVILFHLMRSLLI